MSDPIRAFLRIVQGLFAAALLFQGMEYLQKPHYITTDMPTLYRLDPSKMPQQDVPLAAQGPSLRLFPPANAAPDTTNAPANPADAPEAAVTPEPDQNAAETNQPSAGVETDEDLADATKDPIRSQTNLALAKKIIPWLFFGLGLIVLVLPLSAFTWVLRISLAALFIYSGLLKIKNPATFAQNMACYMQAPSVMINPAAFVLPWIEVLAGIALLIPYLRHAGAFLVLCMLSMFLYATGLALWQGLDISCGCGIEPKPLEWSKIAKNAIYALGCVALLLYRPETFD